MFIIGIVFVVAAVLGAGAIWLWVSQKSMSTVTDNVLEGTTVSAGNATAGEETLSDIGAVVAAVGSEKDTTGDEGAPEEGITGESVASEKNAVGANTVAAEAAVSQTADATTEAAPTEKTTAPRIPVKGIYVTGPTAGSQAMDKLLALVDETELNTMVIDVKNDEGQITYQMDAKAVQELGACTAYITDMDALMAKLKEHNVYTIARIICFKDPCLAQGRPELALKKPDGTPVTDAYGLAWVNPCKTEVWEYLTEVALAAAADGFDEIQYDYVRFPIGKDADAADYGVPMESDTKQKTITGFLTYAAEKLHDKDIVLTADVFGTIIGNDEDAGRVGQDYRILGETVDVLCPMVYPSHYGNGVFGYNVPDAEPYGTVYEALKDSVEALEPCKEQERAVVRPWLQAFTATWVDGHISYGGEQIRQQIQAVYDAGYEEWILWNAANRYSADGLLTEQE